jgi:predicted DNA-binding transcriptional regulator YafY
VWQDRRLHLSYSLPFDTQAEWLVEPHGLVAKDSAWHLVCRRQDHFHVYPVARTLQVRLSEESFERQSGFDLAEFWTRWCVTVETNRPTYTVKVRVSPGWWPHLPRWLGGGATAAMSQAEQPDSNGWRPLTLRFDSLEVARGRLLGCGGGVEILEPRALRQSVADYAAQIATLYQDA